MAQDYILGQVREKALRQVMSSFRQMEIRKARLGNQAGLLGAASLAEEALKGSQPGLGGAKGQ